MRTYGEIRHYRPPESLEVEALSRQPAWQIDCEPHVRERLKRIFPQVNAALRDGAIYLTDTPEASKDLLWVLERWPMRLDDLTRRRLEHRAVEWDEQQEAVQRILNGERLPFALEPAREPRPYQISAADLTLTTGRLLLGDELGLGKTFTALLLLRAEDALPAVVVCPTHLQRQWLDELHLSFPTLRGHIVKKTTVYDPARERSCYGYQPDVLIMSYAKLSGWASHLAGQAQTVIFDEMHELRHDGTAKYGGAGRIADQARYRIGTTGTPVYNYGGEAYNIVNVLARDELGSRSEFLRAWGQELGNGKVGVREPRAFGAHLRDTGLFLRRTRKDVGRELPDVVRIPHDVDADVDRLDQETAAALDLAEMIVSGAGTRQERFVAAGDLDWQMRRATGLAKAPFVAAFVHLLLEEERKLVLYGWHRDVYEIWLNQLAHFQPEMYTGSESVAGKQRAKDRFLNDPDCRILIMSLRSGAGLDGLQEVASVAVFGELDWSPAQHDQCIGRLHRDGQDDPVVAYFLTCDHGSDPVILEALGVKRGQSEPLRDPDAQLFEQAAPDAKDRVRRLAEQALARRSATTRRAA